MMVIILRYVLCSLACCPCRHVSSGCVSIPRCLYLKSGRLFQVPLPELVQLRHTDKCWRAPHRMTLAKDLDTSRESVESGGDSSSSSGAPSCVTAPASVAGDHMDIEICAR